MVPWNERYKIARHQPIQKEFRGRSRARVSMSTSSNRQGVARADHGPDAKKAGIKCVALQDTGIRPGLTAASSRKQSPDGWPKPCVIAGRTMAGLGPTPA